MGARKPKTEIETETETETETKTKTELSQSVNVTYNWRRSTQLALLLITWFINCKFQYKYKNIYLINHVSDPKTIKDSMIIQT